MKKFGRFLAWFGGIAAMLHFLLIPLGFRRLRTYGNLVAEGRIRGCGWVRDNFITGIIAIAVCGVFFLLIMGIGILIHHRGEGKVKAVKKVKWKDFF